jgi:hypothetical protein
MKATRRVRFALFIGVGLLVLNACGAGGGPAIDGTRAWFQALSDLNFDEVIKLTCANPKVQQAIETKLDPFIELRDTLTALKGQFDFSGLKFEEKANDGKTATIHLTGKMLIKALGQSEPLDVFEDILVVNESGTWRVCANPLDIK